MEFFNLNDGQSAVVRILSVSVDKIERGGVHTIVNKDGTKKKVRCLGNNCPLCNSGNEVSNRLFVHLWDYTDNKEKIWNRTPNEKFINQLKEVEADWAPLNSAVIRITREGDTFPKYNIVVVNPKQYAEAPGDLIGANVEWMCSTYRSADELEEFVKTGVLPDHVKKPSNSEWLPKDEWLKQQREKEASTKESTSTYNSGNSIKEDEDDGVPFDLSSTPFGDDFEDPFSSGSFQFDKI